MALLRLNNGNKIVVDNLNEEIYKRLLELTRKLNHLVTYDEFKDYSFLPDPNQYAFYYGSFSSAALKAWKEVERTKKEDECMTEEESRIVDSILESTPVDKEKSQITKKQKVEESIIEFYKNNGRFPTQAECGKPDLPNYATIYKYLGCKSQWANILPDDLKPAGELPDTDPAPAQISESPKLNLDRPVEVKRAAKLSTKNSPQGEPSIGESQPESVGGLAKVEIKITLPDHPPICFSFSI